MMKKLFAVFCLLALPLLAMAHDYKTELEQIKEAVQTFDSEKAYESFNFKNKKTNEVKKIGELSEVDKVVFYFFQGDRLTTSLEETEKKWKASFDKLDAAKEKDKAEEVKKSLDELKELRKLLATRLEAFTESLFKKFPDAFTAEEKEYINKQMREYHDKNKLIERKK